MLHTEGKLIRIPGLPVMHDYEFLPQKVWRIQSKGALFKSTYGCSDLHCYTLPQNL